jgi:hypothetical protein
VENLVSGVGPFTFALMLICTPISMFVAVSRHSLLSCPSQMSVSRLLFGSPLPEKPIRLWIVRFRYAFGMYQLRWMRVTYKTVTAQCGGRRASSHSTHGPEMIISALQQVTFYFEKNVVCAASLSREQHCSRIGSGIVREPVHQLTILRRPRKGQLRLPLRLIGGELHSRAQ